jgi:hypothetical protein
VSTVTLHIGDVFEQLAKIPDGSIDLIVTSPPFLALRSYLPDDHPDKAKEIGSESGPAAFLDTMMALSAEWGRVLAPHGSLCVELGDTYSGSGGAGGDYNADGLRDGQQKFSGSAAKRAALGSGDNERPSRSGRGDDWPLSRSKTMLDTLYPACLAYGANLLSGEVSPAGRWRIRNLIVWARPNPPVGALGDKFRPATSYITVACKSPRRWFDLDAVRGPLSDKRRADTSDVQNEPSKQRSNTQFNTLGKYDPSESGGAPPLDWHADDHPEDGDWLWKMSPQGFKGKATTSRLEACGPDDGGERTTSPDCPVHGGQADPQPTAQCGEHESATLFPSLHSEHNSAGPAPTLQPDCEPSDGSPDREGLSHDPTLATKGQASSEPATPRSSRTHRTDPAPSSAQPCTPSAETAESTGHTPTQPELSEPSLDSAESSISSGDSLASPELQTEPDTAGSQPIESPCTCTFHRRVDESTSHYATFPLALPTRLIKAMCPERVCTVCGAPSERIVSVTRQGSQDNTDGRNGRKVADIERTAETIGWTDCGHNAWRTGRVLDPFAGSGTTLVAAHNESRDAIGVDLDSRNVAMVEDRLGPLVAACDLTVNTAQEAAA